LLPIVVEANELRVTLHLRTTIVIGGTAADIA
jgi:hypothetical protein